MSYFGKFSASPHKKSELPKDYADQILQNDVRLMMSKYTDSQALNNLIQLYMKGIEYYEAQKDSSSEYYKSKLQWLMSHPIISSPKKKETETNQQKKLEFKVSTCIDKQPYYEQPSQLIESTQNNILTTQSNEVKQMIDNLRKETSKINEIIQNDLNSQKTKIADRIHKRTKSTAIKQFNADECVE